MRSALAMTGWLFCRMNGTTKASRLSFFALAALFAFLLSSCAGYRLGPVNGQLSGGKSVVVRPFSNRTTEPRLTDAVTAQVRKAFQRDGTLQLATHEDGDLVLTGTILRYSRQEMSLVAKDVLTVKDYRISIMAQVTVLDRTSGKTIIDKQVTGYTLVRVGTDLVSSERQALPLLAEVLAKRITTLLAEGSW
jgi:hypothetical protein